MNNKIILIVSGIILLVVLIVIIRVHKNEQIDTSYEDYNISNTETSIDIETTDGGYNTPGWDYKQSQYGSAVFTNNVYTKVADVFPNAKVTENSTDDEDSMLSTTLLEEYTGQTLFDLWYTIESEGNTYILVNCDNVVYYYNEKDNIVHIVK